MCDIPQLVKVKVVLWIKVYLGDTNKSRWRVSCVPLTPSSRPNIIKSNLRFPTEKQDGERSAMSWGCCTSHLLCCISKHPVTIDEKQESGLQHGILTSDMTDSYHCRIHWRLDVSRHHNKQCNTFHNTLLLFWNPQCIMLQTGLDRASRCSVCNHNTDNVTHGN